MVQNSPAYIGAFQDGHSGRDHNLSPLVVKRCGDQQARGRLVRGAGVKNSFTDYSLFSAHTPRSRRHHVFTSGNINRVEEAGDDM